MNIYKKYQEFAISIKGRTGGYITKAEREKAKKKNRKKKKKLNYDTNRKNQSGN